MAPPRTLLIFLHIVEQVCSDRAVLAFEGYRKVEKLYYKRSGVYDVRVHVNADRIDAVVQVNTHH